MRFTAIRSAILFLLASNIAGVALGQPVRPERVDLARAYMEYERALRETTLERDVALSLAGRAFDTATVQFFRGNASAALRALNELSAELRGGNVALRTALNSLRLTIEPSVLIAGQEERTLIRAIGMHEAPADIAEASIDQLRFIVRELRGGVLEQVELEADLEAGVLVAEGVWSAGDLEVGDYEMVLSIEDGVERGMGVVSVLARSPEEAVREFRTRIDTLTDAAGLRASKRVVESWIDLVDPEVYRYETTRYLAHPAALHADIERGLAMLESGVDPLADRAGDHWGIIEGPSGEIAYRLYVPEELAKEGERAPLMMVLHGAGGSEHMFFEGCDAGLIKRLADKHGFVAVSPATYPILGHPEAFDVVVETVNTWQPIDHERVLVLGHSLGGITASGLAELRAERIAAICGIAGTRPFSDAKGCAPSLIIGAGEDAVVPAHRLRMWAERAQEQGLPVEYQEAEGLGHTIVVNVVLRDAVDWLLNRYEDAR